MTWFLVNTERRALQGFAIPPRAVRNHLAVGDLVKLVFSERPEDAAAGERMWVEILSAASGRYQGRLRNEPVSIQGLSLGDLVEFGPEHVASWEPA